MTLFSFLLLGSLLFSHKKLSQDYEILHGHLSHKIIRIPSKENVWDFPLSPFFPAEGDFLKMRTMLIGGHGLTSCYSLISLTNKTICCLVLLIIYNHNYQPQTNINTFCLNSPYNSVCIYTVETAAV